MFIEILKLDGSEAEGCKLVDGGYELIDNIETKQVIMWPKIGLICGQYTLTIIDECGVSYV